MQRRAAAGLSFLAICLTGCSIQIDKDRSGREGNVKISTPIGGIDVRRDQTTAADFGMPAYPGAEQSSGEESDRSANVDMGFGPWSLHVKVARYETSDPRDKVLDFYRKALSSYGEVVECKGYERIGPLTAAGSDLNCSNGDDHSYPNINIDDGVLQLKAGSRHHQHIVAFQNESGPPTRFTLIALDLPRLSSGKQGETN